MKRYTILVWVVMLAATMALPAQAAPPATDDFTRTECVIPTGPPAVVKEVGQTLHIRDFPYLGFLTDENGVLTGFNSGFVDIELNFVQGTGSIRGTLTVRDAVMGDFDGRFSAAYRDFAWEGRGAAKGVGDHAGKLLKMRNTGLVPEATCGPSPFPVDWADAAAWDVEITDH